MKRKKMTHICEAIENIVNYPIIKIKSHYTSRNRANSVGEALEKYVKDVFAGTTYLENEIEINKKYSAVYSYLGNQNNPPDIILKNGDAIEIKKVQSPKSYLALNSSYPKAKIYSNSPMITKGCKECEIWKEKDLLYIIGHTNDTEIKHLWMVYGDCFVANKEIYERIKTTISEGVNDISGVEFAHTKELGKVKKVDPLGITDLRIRGMWHIENPIKIFSYLNCSDDSVMFELIVLMKMEKFESFSEDKKMIIENLENNKSIKTSIVEIKNPDNPAKLMKAKLIIFRKK